MSPRLQLRDMVESLHLERFLADCRSRSGLDQELLRDHCFDVLGRMLERSDELGHAFENELAFRGYLRCATLRSAWKQIERSNPDQELDDQRLQDDKSSPERVLNQLNAFELLRLAKGKLERANMSARVQRDCQQLIEFVLEEPDRFVCKRQRGEQAGTLVFQHSALAEALGWPRKRLYERLNYLRTVFFKSV